MADSPETLLGYKPHSAEDNLRFLDFAPEERPGLGLSVQELDILGRINRKVAAKQSCEEIIDFVFDAIRPIRTSDRLSLAMLEDDGRRLVSRHVAADYPDVRLGKGYFEDLHGSSLRTVIETGQPRIINDLELYLRTHPHSRSTRLIVDEGVRSSMTCPLTVDGKSVGVVFWSCRRPHAYNEQRVRRHRAIAERLSQAIGNAHLIEGMQAANDAYMEMLGVVSHELKSPVAAIVTNARLLAEGYLGDLNTRQKDKIMAMVNKGEYLLGIVRRYLDLARIEGGHLQLHSRPIADFVAEVAEPCIEFSATAIEEAGMRLVRCFPAAPVALHGDPDQLRIVLGNLLTNGAKYGVKDGVIELTVTPDADGVTVSVHNDGPGFPPEQQGRLFRRFSRLDSPELMKRKGSGVGLYIAWRIINLHGGRIWAESAENHWARFSFRLPKEMTDD
jgi:hypothetical protein